MHTSKVTSRQRENVDSDCNDVESNESSDPILSSLKETGDCRSQRANETSRSIDKRSSNYKDDEYSTKAPKQFEKRLVSKRRKRHSNGNDDFDREVDDAESDDAMSNAIQRKLSVRRKWSEEELAALKWLIKSYSVPGYTEIAEAKRRYPVLESRSRETIKARIVHLMKTGR